MTYAQADRALTVTTPLGADALLLTAVRGREAVSELFRFRLEMLSPDHAIVPEKMIGRPIGFGMRMADGRMRPVHGRIARFWVGWTRPDGLRRYQAEVEPLFAFLRHVVDSRVYRDMSVPEIAQSIFERFYLTDVDTTGLGETHAALEYSVQYQESCYDYLCRLFETEGIFFFFRHHQDRHILVLADTNAAFQDAAETDLPYRPDADELGVLTSWDHRYTFLPLKLAANDYNPQTPAAPLDLERPTMIQQLCKAEGVSFESYEWPGGFSTREAGETVMRHRLEEAEVGFHQIEGASACPGLAAGGRITLAEYPDHEEYGHAYYLLSVEHEARDDSLTTGGGGSGYRYANRFDATPAVSRVNGMEKPHRPARKTPKPRVHGTQTAVVVGPEGETIHCDSEGRVKIQFHWDRHGGHDDTSSCWVRVSQEWAGKSFGAAHVPHVGQEVLVSFVDGDLDRPVIVGRVHNAEQRNPLVADALAHKSQTLLRDQGGNHILTEGKEGSQRVHLRSPTAKGQIEIGALRATNPAAKLMNRFRAAFPAATFPAPGSTPGPGPAMLAAGDPAAPSDWNDVVKDVENGVAITTTSDLWVESGDSYSYVNGVTYAITQGDSHDAVEGDSTSDVRGDSTSTTYGNSTSLTHGDTSSTLYGNAWLMNLGVSNSCLSLAFNEMIYAGETSYVTLGLTLNLQVGGQMTVILGPNLTASLKKDSYTGAWAQYAFSTRDYSFSVGKMAATSESVALTKQVQAAMEAKAILRKSEDIAVGDKTYGVKIESAASALKSAAIEVKDGMVMMT